MENKGGWDGADTELEFEVVGGSGGTGCLCSAQECVADLVSLGKGSVCTMWREGKKWGVLRVEWRECFWGPASP